MILATFGETKVFSLKMSDDSTRFAFVIANPSWASLDYDGNRIPTPAVDGLGSLVVVAKTDVSKIFSLTTKVDILTQHSVVPSVVADIDGVETTFSIPTPTTDEAIGQIVTIYAGASTWEKVSPTLLDKEMEIKEIVLRFRENFCKPYGETVESDTMRAALESILSLEGIL